MGGFSNEIKTILKIDGKDWEKSIKSISEAEKSYFKESTENIDKLINSKEELAKTEAEHRKKIITLNREIKESEKQLAKDISSNNTEKIKQTKELIDLKKKDLDVSIKAIDQKRAEVKNTQITIEQINRYKKLLDETKNSLQQLHGQESKRQSTQEKDIANMKEQYKTTYELTSAQVKYNEAKKRLDSMLTSGAISQEQYNKGLSTEGKLLKENKGSYESATNAVVRHLRQIETLIVSYYMLKGAWDATIGVGIRVNRMMEDNANGIAALLSANTAMTLSNGKAVTSYQKFSMGQAESIRIMEKLRIASIKTYATFPQLTEIFQQAYGQALSMGDGLGKSVEHITDNTIKLSQRMSNIAGAIGMPMDRVKEEVRSLLSGNASTDSLISTMIFGSPGQANEAINKAKEKGGGAVKDLLDKMLEPFDALENIDSYTKNLLELQDAYQNTMKVMSEPIYHGLADTFKILSKALNDNKGDLIGFGDTFGDVLKQVNSFGSSLGAVFGSIISVADMFSSDFKNVLKTVSMAVQFLNNGMLVAANGLLEIKSISQWITRDSKGMEETEKIIAKNRAMMKSFEEIVNDAQKLGEKSKKRSLLEITSGINIDKTSLKELQGTRATLLAMTKGDTEAQEALLKWYQTSTLQIKAREEGVRLQNKFVTSAMQKALEEDKELTKQARGEIALIEDDIKKRVAYIDKLKNDLKTAKGSDKESVQQAIDEFTKGNIARANKIAEINKKESTKASSILNTEEKKEHNIELQRLEEDSARARLNEIAKVYDGTIKYDEKYLTEYEKYQLQKFNIQEKELNLAKDKALQITELGTREFETSQAQEGLYNNKIKLFEYILGLSQKQNDETQKGIDLEQKRRDDIDALMNKYTPKKADEIEDIFKKAEVEQQVHNNKMLNLKAEADEVTQLNDAFKLYMDMFKKEQTFKIGTQKLEDVVLDVNNDSEITTEELTRYNGEIKYIYDMFLIDLGSVLAEGSDGYSKVQSDIEKKKLELGNKAQTEKEKSDKKNLVDLGGAISSAITQAFMDFATGKETSGTQLASNAANSVGQAAMSAGMSSMMGGMVASLGGAGAMGVGVGLMAVSALLEKPQETLISQENYLEQLTNYSKSILEETKAFRILNKIFGTDYKADKTSFLQAYGQGYTLNTNVGTGMQNYIESLFTDIENATMKYTIKVGEQTVQKTKSGFLGIGASSSTEVRDIWKTFTGTEVAALQFLSQFGVDKEGSLTSEGLQGVTSAFNAWDELMTTLDDYQENITDIEKVTKELARIDTRSIKDEMYQMYSNELSNVGINIAQLTVDNIGEAFSDTTLGELIKNNPSLNVEALTGYVNELNSSYLKQIELTKELNALRLEETLSQMDLAKELKDYETQIKDLNKTLGVSFKGTFDPFLNALKSIKDMAQSTADSLGEQDIRAFWELDDEYQKLMRENRFEEAQAVFSEISSLSGTLSSENEGLKAGIASYMEDITKGATSKETEINKSLMSGIGSLYNLTTEQLKVLQSVGADGSITNSELESLTFATDDLKTTLIDAGFIETNTILGSIEEYARLQLEELQDANTMETASLSTDTFKYLDYLGKKEQFDIASSLGKSFADVEDFIYQIQSFDIKDNIQDLEEMKSLIGYSFNTETGLVSYDQSKVTDLSKIWDVLPQDVKDAYGALSGLATTQQSEYLSGKQSSLTPLKTTIDTYTSEITPILTRINEIIDIENKTADWHSTNQDVIARLLLDYGKSTDVGSLMTTGGYVGNGLTLIIDQNLEIVKLFESLNKLATDPFFLDTSISADKYTKAMPDGALGAVSQIYSNSTELDVATAQYNDLLKLINSYKATDLPSFDVGSAYIPNDMIAQIHHKEMIIDPQSSDVLRKYGIKVNTQTPVNNLTTNENKGIIEAIDKLASRLDKIEQNTKKSATVLDEAQYGQRTLKVEMAS